MTLHQNRLQQSSGNNQKRAERLFFYVRPAWVLSNGLKSRVRPSSGKYIA